MAIFAVQDPYYYYKRKFREDRTLYNPLFLRERTQKNHFSMAGNVELLKKGFAALQKHVTTRKTSIQDRLEKQEPIDDEDNAWLDGPANLVDEQQALELLENASDYGRGLSRIGEALQAAVQRMTEFAAGVKTSVAVSKLPKAPGNKRKSACLQFNSFLAILNP